MPADDVPAIHREPDGAVLLVYPGGRRIRILPGGHVEGLKPLERLFMVALRAVGTARERRRFR